MTRKDYELIADIIRKHTDSVQDDYLHLFTFLPDLAAQLKKENPRFDGYRFLEACKRNITKS